MGWASAVEEFPPNWPGGVRQVATRSSVVDSRMGWPSAVSNVHRNCPGGGHQVATSTPVADSRMGWEAAVVAARQDPRRRPVARYYAAPSTALGDPRVFRASAISAVPRNRAGGVCPVATHSSASRSRCRHPYPSSARRSVSASWNHLRFSGRCGLGEEEGGEIILVRLVRYSGCRSYVIIRGSERESTGLSRGVWARSRTPLLQLGIGTRCALFAYTIPPGRLIRRHRHDVSRINPSLITAAEIGRAHV